MIWINEERVKPTDDIPVASAKDWVADDTVRIYDSWTEVADHIGGKTDYIGNIIGGPMDGTWVRFSKDGLNILGEHHDHVPLLHLVPVLNTTNFIDEALATDRFEEGSHLHKEYLLEYGDFFKAFGIATDGDLSRYGAESLYPKIAHLMTGIAELINGGFCTEPPGENWLLGSVGRGILRAAWAFAKDLTAEQPTTEAEKALVAVSAEHFQTLQEFITGLPARGRLDADLELPLDPRLEPLSKFANAVGPAIRERINTDDGLFLVDRTNLLFMYHATHKQQLELFLKWRDHHFSNTLKAAEKNNVRYLGLGVSHLAYLIKESQIPPSEIHLYDTRPETAAPIPELDGPKAAKDIGRLTEMAAATEARRGATS